MNNPFSGDAGPPPSIPSIPNDILIEQKHGQAILIWAIGAFCIFGWELVLCAPKEYRLVWRKPLNLSSILYLVNRYFGLVEFCFVVSMATNSWSPSSCKHVFMLEPIGSLISTILSQAILGGRVHAIYGRNMALGTVLGIILIGEVLTGGIAISTSSEPPQIPFAPPSSQLPCGALTGPLVWLTAYWAVPLLYDSLTFGLTVWKAYDLWRREVDTPIFDIIWRDGSLYFFANFVMNAVNIIIFVIAPPSLRGVNLAPTIMLQIILSCRMFLKLKASSNLSSRGGRQNTTDRTKFRSQISSGTLSKDNTKVSGPASVGPIPVDMKGVNTASTQEYELDVQANSSLKTWDMA